VVEARRPPRAGRPDPRGRGARARRRGDAGVEPHGGDGGARAGVPGRDRHGRGRGREAHALAAVPRRPAGRAAAGLRCRASRRGPHPTCASTRR
jgi:hypothetical protein